MAKTESTQPLQGVRVVELTDGVAGAYAGRLLAVLGAEVVKVEPPNGDVVRRWGPFPATTQARRSTSRVPCTCISTPTNVRSWPTCGQNVTSTSFVAAPTRDIVLESFAPGDSGSPGRAANLGLDAATLQASNPALVVTSMTPFGQSGPYAEDGLRGS